ncbi:MAG: hypothetical protein H6679_00850 [Epsilonproteobacteria bacterium]|nr:hypothetical protein [Campylobacterota bacterium]
MNISTKHTFFVFIILITYSALAMDIEQQTQKNLDTIETNFQYLLKHHPSSLLECFKDSSSLQCVAISNNEEYIALASARGTIAIYSRLTKTHTMFATDQTNIRKIAFSYNGNHLFVLSDNSVQRYLLSGELRHMWPSPTPLLNMALSANGKTLLIVSEQGIHLFSSSDLYQITSIDYKTNVSKTLFSPAKSYIAILCASTSNLFLYNFHAKKTILLAHPGHVFDMVFSPTEKKLATLYKDKGDCVKLWNFAGVCLATLKQPYGTHTFKFSECGKLLIVGTGNELRTFCTTTGNLVATTQAGIRPIETIISVPKSNYFLTAQRNSTDITLWTVKNGVPILIAPVTFPSVFLMPCCSSNRIMPSPLGSFCIFFNQNIVYQYPLPRFFSTVDNDNIQMLLNDKNIKGACNENLN